MTSRADPIYADLRDAIAQADDPKDRAILLIMQRVLARVEESLNDDIAIRAKVLNGLNETHHDDHVWVKLHREEEVGRALLCERTKRAVEWVEARKDEAKDTKKRVFDLVGGIAEKLIWAILGVAGYGFLAGWPLVFK